MTLLSDSSQRGRPTGTNSQKQWLLWPIYLKSFAFEWLKPINCFALAKDLYFETKERFTLARNCLLWSNELFLCWPKIVYFEAINCFCVGQELFSWSNKLFCSGQELFTLKQLVAVLGKNPFCFTPTLTITILPSTNSPFYFGSEFLFWTRIFLCLWWGVVFVFEPYVCVYTVFFKDLIKPWDSYEVIGWQPSPSRPIWVFVTQVSFMNCASQRTS